MIYLAAAVAAAVAVALALTAAFPAPAAAATTVTVTTTADDTHAGDGKCSLREATLYANGAAAERDCAAVPASGTTTIIVPASPSPYTLGGQVLSLTASATMTGAGATTTVIDAAGRSQVFFIQDGANVAISGLTITGGVSGQTAGPDPVFGLLGGGINNNGTLALNHVIVTHNRTSPGATTMTCTELLNGCPGGTGGDGGGINNDGTLTIANSAITSNSTGGGTAGTIGPTGKPGGLGGSGGSGGGIRNFQTLTITNSTIVGNTTGAGADGGRGGDGASTQTGSAGGSGGTGGNGGSGAGIENSGQLVISGSTIAGNETGTGGNGGHGGAGTGLNHDGGIGGVGGGGGPGGAIASNTDMTISNSTIADNTAATSGASGDGGTPNGTKPNPVGGGNGGGIDQLAMGSTLTHVTIASNRAAGIGGGVNGDGGTISPGNSIIASNQAALGQNCDGVLTDQGGNLEFGGSSCPGGFVRADPRLAPLGNNGGPTQTVALQPGSAAIHHVRTCVLATDQRGVGRPVGQPCDSGAYQVAPPSLSGISATAITTDSVTIAASANPNLQDSRVVVNYGRTPSYGASTPPRDIGAGNSPAGFTVALGGLAPGTTYHFNVVATNADGQTTSSDGVFATLPPITASIARAATTGPTLSLTIACAGGFGPGTCAGTIRLTARGTPKAARTAKHKGKPSGKPHVVAAGAYSVASGSRVTLRLRLNGMGRTLLAARYVLPVMLSMRGTTPLTRTVTFRYPVIKTKPSYTFSVNADGSSTVTELTVTHLLRGGRVRVICQGGGCPFPQHTFTPKHGQVITARSFLHSTLRPGASVRVEVLAANHVGAVWILTPRIGPKVTAVRLCLPPGAARPARCV